MNHKLILITLCILLTLSMIACNARTTEPLITGHVVYEQPTDQSEEQQVVEEIEPQPGVVQQVDFSIKGRT